MNAGHPFTPTDRKIGDGQRHKRDLLMIETTGGVQKLRVRNPAGQALWYSIPVLLLNSSLLDNSSLVPLGILFSSIFTIFFFFFFF